jgi:hypothetical protein
MPPTTSRSISIDNAGKGAASTGTSAEAMALGAVTHSGPGDPPVVKSPRPRLYHVFNLAPACSPSDAVAGVSEVMAKLGVPTDNSRHFLGETEPSLILAVFITIATGVTGPAEWRQRTCLAGRCISEESSGDLRPPGNCGPRTPGCRATICFKRAPETFEAAGLVVTGHEAVRRTEHAFLMAMPRSVAVSMAAFQAAERAVPHRNSLLGSRIRPCSLTRDHSDNGDFV